MIEYPLVMVHPNHVPAQVERPSPGKPLVPGESPRASRSEIYPPVTVNNEDQHEYYKAQGYRAASEGHMAYDYQEYPKWVAGRIVHSAEEEAALSAPAKPRKAKVKA